MSMPRLSSIHRLLCELVENPKSKGKSSPRARRPASPGRRKKGGKIESFAKLFEAMDAQWNGELDAEELQARPLLPVWFVYDNPASQPRSHPSLSYLDDRNECGGGDSSVCSWG